MRLVGVGGQAQEAVQAGVEALDVASICETAEPSTATARIQRPRGLAGATSSGPSVVRSTTARAQALGGTVAVP